MTTMDAFCLGVLYGLALVGVWWGAYHLGDRWGAAFVVWLKRKATERTDWDTGPR